LGWPNFSDAQVEYQVRDRLSFTRFLRLGIEDRIPDGEVRSWGRHRPFAALGANIFKKRSWNSCCPRLFTDMQKAMRKIDGPACRCYRQ
jgi:hypothetical protein